MIASFHVVAYRKRVISPPQQLGARVGGLRFWTPLNVGGDFAWFRDHANRRSLYPRLRPDFRRWAFYAVWDEEAALDEFLTGSEIGRAWEETTVEACHLWLRPNRTRGPWHGMRVLRGSEGAREPDAPVAYLTRLDLSLRGTVAMWGWAAPGILPHLPDSAEMLLGLPLVDRPYLQPVSFSVWRNLDSALSFVRGPHRQAVQRVSRSQQDVVERFSFGRFEPYRCQGTWKGRDVLAGLRRGTAPGGAHSAA